MGTGVGQLPPNVHRLEIYLVIVAAVSPSCAPHVKKNIPCLVLSKEQIYGYAINYYPIPFAPPFQIVFGPAIHVCARVHVCIRLL